MLQCSKINFKFKFSSLAYHHGTKGPMVIENPRHFSKLRSAFFEAGRWMGFDILDQNGASQVGFAPYLFTINDGWRWTTAEG